LESARSRRGRGRRPYGMKMNICLSPRAEATGHEAANLGGCRADLNPDGLERFLLRLGRSRGAGDDRARVSHRLARRCGETGDVCEHGLRHVVLAVPRGLLLLVAADLADEDDQLGLRVRLELLEHVDEGG